MTGWERVDELSFLLDLTVATLLLTRPRHKVSLAVYCKRKMLRTVNIELEQNVS